MCILRAYGVWIAVFLLGLGPALPALAQGVLGDPDDRREPPPSLPQSFNGIIYPPSGEEFPTRVDTLSDIVRAMQACWRPTSIGYTGQSVTIRISFKRNGEVLGKP